MVASLLITFREGLEAALIVSIVLGVLNRLGVARKAIVWWGVATAVVASVLASIALNAFGLRFEGRGEEIFEGIAMLVAAGILTWVIFWMHRQGKEIAQGLKRDAQEAANANKRWPLFWLAFTSVFREGIETVLFLTAAAFTATAAQTLTGAALGLLAAVAVGWLIVSGGARLPVAAFFRWTGLLLILVAAGLVAHGLHELQEAGIVPIIIEHVWDLNGVLDEGGTVGSLLKVIFGYNGNPSLIEALSYALFLVSMGALMVGGASTGRRLEAGRQTGAH